LEADVFSRFRKEGIMNPAVGKAYMESILTQGDSDEPGALFKRFMGRDVDRKAFLIRNLGSLDHFD
jgi:oligopeptidase A